MSVLLEALKKAALEKRTREESEGGEDPPAPATELHADGDALAETVAPVVDEPIPLKPVVNTAAADYLAQQEAKRAPRAFDDIEKEAELQAQATEAPAANAEPEPELQPDPQPKPGEQAEAATAGEHSPHWADVNNSVAGDAAAAEGVNEEPREPLSNVHDFSLPETAAEAAERPAGESAPDEHLTGLAFLHEHEHENDHQEDLDLDLDVAAAAEFDDPAADPPAEPEAEVNPAAAAGIDQAEQRRAMQQLMARSREVLQRSKRRGNYMHAALLLTSICAIGLYYWVLSHSDVLMVPEPPAMPTTNEVAVQPAQAEAAPAETSTVSDPDTLQPAVAAEATVIVEPPAAAPVVNAPVGNTAPAAREPVAPVRELVSESTEPAYASASRVLIERRQTPRPLARKVNDAYRAYEGGDLDRASSLYREVLEESPRQRDALLGAAAIAVQRGQYQDALRFYQRRLVDDSSDHFARAGLLALASQGVADPELQSEVKILLDDHPQQAHLHFLLGSLQAAAGSWPEAQRAFFEARSWDRENPDYAYNLAVSLEHLRLPTQALAQYRQALELAELATPQFDTAVASRRVAYLETRQP